MHGKNPARPIISGEGNTLYIQEIFATFQGEGLFAGTPAVFIRLGGCNLSCDFCDAEFESYKEMLLEKIIEDVRKLSHNSNGDRCKHLVVITGGEPLRQPIENLCQTLIADDFKVQIETNGTIFRNLPDDVHIICSPKNLGAGYKRIRKDLLPKIDSFKFIISATDPLYKNVTDVGQTEYNIPVYIQPMDEYDEDKNKENMNYVKDLAMENNYIVSIQLQKIVGVK